MQIHMVALTTEFGSQKLGRRDFSLGFDRCVLQASSQVYHWMHDRELEP